MFDFLHLHNHFARPGILILILLVPIIAIFFAYSELRVGKRGLRHSNITIFDRIPALPDQKLRYIAPFLAIAATMCIIYACAGPYGALRLSNGKATVILIIDTSISMECDDVQPTRIAAAQYAAKSFIGQLDRGVNVGLVSFNSGATIEAEPTLDRKRLYEKIDNLKLDTYTATGRGIETGLEMLSTFNERFTGGGIPQGVLVLESDGKETVPLQPDFPGGENVMARKAKGLNVPIHTISFGTAHGTIVYEGQRVPVPVDDASLAKVAELSGGKSYTARNFAQLLAAYSKLSREMNFRTERAENPYLALVTAVVLLSGSLIASTVLNVRSLR